MTAKPIPADRATAVGGRADVIAVTPDTDPGDRPYLLPATPDTSKTAQESL